VLAARVPPPAARGRARAAERRPAGWVARAAGAPAGAVPVAVPVAVAAAAVGTSIREPAKGLAPTSKANSATAAAMPMRAARGRRGCERAPRQRQRAGA
jgi:hypothetical protein